MFRSLMYALRCHVLSKGARNPTKECESILYLCKLRICQILHLLYDVSLEISIDESIKLFQDFEKSGKPWSQISPILHSQESASSYPQLCLLSKNKGVWDSDASVNGQGLSGGHFGTAQGETRLSGAEMAIHQVLYFLAYDTVPENVNIKQAQLSQSALSLLSRHLTKLVS